jgi:hypothetical protein
VDSFEAREILALYRPGDTNHLDPRMAEALDLARRDPQLAVWFGQHCAAHVKLAGEPELLGAPAAAKPGKPAEVDEHIIPINRTALFMIGAAGLAVVSIFLWTWLTPRPRNNFANYRDRMARLVQRSYPVKILLTDQAQIRQYFHSNSGPYDFPMPHNLEKFPGTGAAVMTWHSQPVSMMGLAAGRNTNLYIFVIKKSTFTDEFFPASTQYARVGRLMTASWAGPTNVYLLTGPNDTAALQYFLTATP